jgi:hypothetical protein
MTTLPSLRGQVLEASLSQHVHGQQPGVSQAAAREAPAGQSGPWIGLHPHSETIILQESIKLFFQDDLHEVLHYERDFATKFIVWVMMLLQFFKLSVVGGAPFIRLTRFLYFFGWLTIEIILVYATIPSEPTSYEKQEAQSLWSKFIISHVSIWVSETWRTDESKLQEAAMNFFWVIMSFACLSHAFFAWALSEHLKSLIYYGEYFHDLIWSRVESLGPFVYSIIAASIGISTMTMAFLVTFLIIFPIWIFCLRDGAIGAWNRSDLAGVLRRLPSPNPSRSLKVSLFLFVPNWLALWHFASILAAVAGVNYWVFWDVRYKCWETTKPQSYDWLG